MVVTSHLLFITMLWSVITDSGCEIALSQITHIRGSLEKSSFPQCELYIICVGRFNFWMILRGCFHLLSWRCAVWWELSNVHPMPWKMCWHIAWSISKSSGQRLEFAKRCDVEFAARRVRRATRRRILLQRELHSVCGTRRSPQLLCGSFVLVLLW